MMNMFYAVIPFVRTQNGLAKGEAQLVPSPAYARRYGEKIGGAVVGLLAFSRKQDPVTGEWQAAEIIGVYGKVPDEALEP